MLKLFEKKRNTGTILKYCYQTNLNTFLFMKGKKLIYYDNTYKFCFQFWDKG